jgi:NAD(P)-dependent dehydrogenase (short-subunit alcohol dehydrogenase family)
MNTYNPFSLKNKTILVTGASSGIGRAIAVECSRMDATVILTARNKIRLRETLEMMNGSDHSIIVADLVKPEDRTLLAEKLPTIDGLVNCAGLVKTLPVQFIKESDLDEVMTINFTAPTLLTTMLIKKKKLTKGSSIVFISSVSGTLVGVPANSIYSASKGAVNGMVKNMAVDLLDKNIRVNSVLPGQIATPLTDHLANTQEQFESDKKRYLMKRYGNPEEVAYAVIYLLSDASVWMTGSNIVIDGGVTLS